MNLQGVKQALFILAVITFSLIFLKSQLLSSERDVIAVSKRPLEDVLPVTNTNSNEIGAGGTILSSTTCVPGDLQYLSTEYTAKLCNPDYLWSQNHTSLQNLTCKYPTLNPFDETIVPFLGKSVKRNVCNKTSNVTKIFTTDYHSNLITLESPENFGFFGCCYRILTLVGNDYDVAKVSKECIPITTPKQRVNAEFIKIVCFTNETQNQSWWVSESSETVMDFQAFVPLKLEGSKNSRNLDGHLNVAILGLDAISHMNLIRTMPKSYEYIQEGLGAFGFFGYNSVGDNTFSNLVPLHFGYNASFLNDEEAFHCPSHGPFDKCPFLWKEFSNYGYHTIFGEDASFLGTWHYSRHGFRKPPTDYYLRQFFITLDRVYHHGGESFPCWAGPRLYFEHLLDYMKSVAVTMDGSNRYFQLLWESAMCHSYIKRPVAGDDSLLEALTWFKKNNYLNNTILILMSDHGMRYDGIRSTMQGRVEALTPFLFFVVPDWFQQKYRRATQNLRKNKYKLTTTFDIHWTLRDLLTMNIDDEAVKRREEDGDDRNPWQFGQSLFLPVSDLRECPDAGIPEDKCNCRKYHEITDKSAEMTNIAGFVVKKINKQLKKHKQCAKLVLKEALKAFTVYGVPRRTNGKKSSKNVSATERNVVMLSLSTLPGDAIFEAEVDTTTTATGSEKQMELLGSVKRISKYGNQSYCVDVYEMKPFCFCKEFLKV